MVNYEIPDNRGYLPLGRLHPVFDNQEEFVFYCVLMGQANIEPVRFLTPALDEIILEPGYILERPHEIAWGYPDKGVTWVEEMIEKLVAHELLERTMGILRLTRIDDYIVYDEPENPPNP